MLFSVIICRIWSFATAINKLLFDKNCHIYNSYQKGAIFYQSHKVFYTTSYPDQTRNGASNLRKGRKIKSRLMPSTEITSMTASAFSFCSLTHTRTHLPQAYRNIWRYETAPHK